MLTSSVADWMSTPPILLGPTTTLAEAERIMERKRVRRLPVVEHEQLIGIITKGDLRAAQPSAATTLSVYEWRALLERTTVAECMTRNPISIAPNATVLAAAQLMLDHKISGLPVVANGHVVGVITESDLFRLLLADARGGERQENQREIVKCWRCGTLLRRQSLETLGPDDTCWQCHYHQHRCENCRYFDGIACMIDRPERHTAVPGQHCQSFALIAQPVASLGVEIKQPGGPLGEG